MAVVAPGAGTTAKFMGVERPDVAAPIAKCDHGCFNTSTQDVCAPFDHRMTNAIRPENIEQGPRLPAQSGDDLRSRCVLVEPGGFFRTRIRQK